MTRIIDFPNEIIQYLLDTIITELENIDQFIDIFWEIQRIFYNGKKYSCIHFVGVKYIPGIEFRQLAAKSIELYNDNIKQLNKEIYKLNVLYDITKFHALVRQANFFYKFTFLNNYDISMHAKILNDYFSKFISFSASKKKSLVIEFKIQDYKIFSFIRKLLIVDFPICTSIRRDRTELLPSKEVSDILTLYSVECRIIPKGEFPYPHDIKSVQFRRGISL